MSVEDTKLELREYGRWAAIKANEAMWYQPMGYYPSNVKSDPIMITLDRAHFIDRVLSSVRNEDEAGYEALTLHLVGRMSYREIAEEMECSFKQAGIMVNNTISVVHGVLIAQNIALDT